MHCRRVHSCSRSATPSSPASDQEPTTHGAGVGVLLVQGDLARSEELGPAEQALAFGRAFGMSRVVAAPGHVGGPHLAVAVREPGGAGGQHQGGVVSGTTVPGLTHMGADQPGSALRGALAAPAAGEVEQLGGVWAHRQYRPNGLEVQLVRGGVRDGRPHPNQALAAELDLHADPPARFRIGRYQRHAAVGALGGAPGPVAQPRRPGTRRASRTEPFQRGQPGEPGHALADDAPPAGVVERGVGDPGCQDGEQVGPLVIELSQGASPVQDQGHTRRGGREHQAHALPRQVDRMGRHPAVIPSPLRT